MPMKPHSALGPLALHVSSLLLDSNVPFVHVRPRPSPLFFISQLKYYQIRDKGQETRETRDKRQETRDKRQETRDKRHEIRDKRQETRAE
jgi:hypothetical protein